MFKYQNSLPKDINSYKIYSPNRANILVCNISGNNWWKLQNHHQIQSHKIIISDPKNISQNFGTSIVKTFWKKKIF